MTNETIASQQFRGFDSVPFIYFDHVPNAGIRNGVLQFELAADALMPGNTRPIVIGTARLRCSPTAARRLREVINKVLLTLDQIASGQEPMKVALGSRV